jgi:hypothetical protein
MSSYRLVDHGYPFKKIMHGRKWVGRVYRHADGSWRGMINKTELASGSSPREAFEQAVAKHLGYGDVSELNERNRQVRRTNAARRQEVQQAMRDFLGGKTNALDALFKMETDND